MAKDNHAASGSEGELKRLPLDEIELITSDPLALETRDDIDRVVPALPIQAFVTAARKLRDEQRLDLLVEHATSEQIVGVFDLDAWERDRIVAGRARDWLFRIAATYDAASAPRGRLVEIMYATDPEMWTFALLAGTKVAELDQEDDERRQAAFESMASLAVWESPDGWFAVGVPDDEFGHQALAVIEMLYRDDLAEGRKLLLSLAWGLASEIEETLLGFRSGRLADLGFPAWEDAMRLFRPLARDAIVDPEAEPPPRQRVLGPGTEITWTHGGDLLRRVMALLDDAEHGERVREFMLLVNEMMAAQRFEPGDEKLQARAVAQAQASLNLAFELLAAHTPDASDIDAWLADRVRTAGLRKLFRHAYGPLAKLRTAALTLHRSGRVSLSRIGSLLDRPWGAGLRALAALYPELPLADRPANEPRRVDEKTRPLRTLADLGAATAMIAEAGALARLAFDAGGCGFDPMWVTRVDEPGRLHLGDLVRSGLVCRARGVDARPLDLDDVEWAASELISERRLIPKVSEQLRALLDATTPDLGTASRDAACDSILVRMEAELGTLDRTEEGAPDLTRLGGFLTIQTVATWLRLRNAD